ncbi:MAG TPA: sulfite exporter TauE/SafE family protein [Pyrinomonadaceae bacterium]|nr:sulfite exporter TauE/SafE family protein [Pyrinomonadaceae bacterium]
MDATLLQGLSMVAAAFVAGMMNSIAGGGTLITFPVLLWLGLDPKVANATSTVALWPGLFGGLWGFRRETANSRTILVRLGLTSVVGGAVGALLLILTPSETFARLVPFLIFFATVLFILQEPISRRLGTPAAAERPRARWWLGAIVFQFFSSVYGGYFGAGNGILMLAALGLLGLNDIHRANGIKNFLGIAINSAAVIGFALSRLVVWPVALLMAVAATAGGYFGANTARRLGRPFVRRAVITIGLVIGFVMLWRMGKS